MPAMPNNTPMTVKEACVSVLDEVKDVIEQIGDSDFVKPVEAFNGSSIGQHFRHTLEFLQCLMSGSTSGVVSYDKRDHDVAIESDKILALEVLDRAKQFIAFCDIHEQIKLEVSYDPGSDIDVIIDSNLAREITYNIEHIIHHMALIKIGIRDICPYVELPEGFGIAVSTLKFRQRQSID
jgi:hypothetical protein